MQGRRNSARALIGAFTFAASTIALAPPSEAAPAESCLKAPRGVAPQGSHWYYRIERPSQRHCWYLAAVGIKTARRAAVRTAPQAEPDDEPEAQAPAPVVDTSPPPAAEPPKPVITTLVTRNVSNPGEIAPPPAAEPAQTAVPSASSDAVRTEAPPVAPQQPAANDQPAASVAAQPPAPPPAPAAKENATSSGGTMPTLQFLLGAIALLGFVTSAGFFALAMLRRRNDVLNTRRGQGALPFEASPETAVVEDRTFQPLPAIDPIRRHDDVDAALQRLARRRRAAALG